MEHFEIGCCFKSYNELIEKLKEYCKATCTKFTTKDSRLITDEFASAKESFVYSELKLICVHGRTPKIKGGERKRKIRTLKIKKTECPAYFRIKLINSGVALQIVAMNERHNHPLEKVDTEEPPPKPKRKKRGDDKHVNSFKLEIKSEDSVSSDELQASEFIEVFIDRDDPEKKIEFSFRGLCAPVFNIFDEDESLDVEVIPKYAKFLAEEGIKAVLVNDILGEYSSMSVVERKTTATEWAKAVKSTEQHLMVQIGGCALPDVVELAKHAEKTGADSVLCLPEACFKAATPKELVEYLKIVGEAAPNTPLLYHHVPHWTNVNVDMELFLKECVGKIPTFCGISYTSNDFEGGVAALEVDNINNVVFFGADKLLVGAFSMGFDSAILPSLNIFPKYAKDILEAVGESKLDEARKNQKELSTKYDVICKFGTLVPAMKAAMNMSTPINVGLVRTPLKNLTDKEIEDMKKQLEL